MSTAVDQPEPISWAEVSCWSNSENRALLLYDHAHELDASDFWEGVADAWRTAKYGTLTKAQWRELWTLRPLRWDLVMDMGEQEQFKALPDRVTIYRGVNSLNEIRGLSWTLDRELAHWFADRHLRDGDRGHVCTARVLRERILALFRGRGESEVVVFPKHVYRKRWEPVDPEAVHHYRLRRAMEEEVGW